MNFKVSVHIIFLSLLVDALAVTAVQSNIAKPNCPDKCGGVNISYPFGIGKECYHSQWFSITCKSKPFLTRVNLEVEAILIEDNLVVLNSPLTGANSNCVRVNGSSRNVVWTSPDFGDSPFVFSRELNTLKVVGCDSALLQTYRKGVNYTTLAGCMSSCTDTDMDFTQGCFGFSRCRTSIPVDDLSNYRIVMNGNATSNCTYAFLLGEYGMFHDSFVDMLTNAPSINETGLHLVPVIMKWRLDHLGELELGNFTTYLCMEEEQSSMSMTKQSSYSCKCSKNYQGNPYFVDGCKVVDICAKCEKDCFRTPDGEHYCNRKLKSEVILGFRLGGGLLFLLLSAGFFSWLYKLFKKKRILLLKKKFFKKNGGLLLQQRISSDESTVENAIVFTAKDLEKATDKFNENRILGQGGQGTVYKGMLRDGKIVAIKKSNAVDESQLQQFINEVVILSQINHRNIVRLLGCCLETQVPLLVYEFISNGNLSELIQDQNEEFPFSWKMRLQIATEVAGALAYLHSSSSTPIYHRDIKSANILLDEKYRAKVADFGTSRTITIDQTHLTTLVCGTFGYLDPEYFQSSQFTDKSDVYNFGVVLVELLTGQKPISSTNSNQARSLASRFMMHLEESRLSQILDARVKEEATDEEVNVVADIAKRCLNLNGKRRPPMKQVMMELEGVRMTAMPLASSALKNVDADEKRIETKDVRISQSNRSHQRVFSDVESLLINTI